MSNSSTESDSSLDDKKRKRKHKKEKHRKKTKKLKKHKKYRKPKSSSEESTSESEEEWIVKESPKLKETIQNDTKNDNNSTRNASSKVNNDSWDNFGSIIHTFSNDSKKIKENRKMKLENARAKAELDQKSLELNPYWKDGGDGLPPQDTSIEANVAPVVGDGGLLWLKKSYLRAKEQAIEQNRSLEEIAAERWGSLEKFYEMLEDAEAKAKMKDFTSYKAETTYSRSKFKKPRQGSGTDSDDGGSHKIIHEKHFPRKHDKPSWRKPKGSHSATTSKVDFDFAGITAENASQVPSLSQHEKNSVPENQTPEKMKSEHIDEAKVLTDQEMNALSAKILKAEMLGNKDLAADLKMKHATEESRRRKFIENGGDPQSQSKQPKVVTKIVMDQSSRSQKSRDKQCETHKDGQRIRYFPDDDKHSLQNMFQKEKINTVEDENALFSRLVAKGSKIKTNDDYDLDDMFTDKASSSKKVHKEKEREVTRIIEEEKFYTKTLENCSWCLEGSKFEKHLLISRGEKCYLCVPPFRSLTEGHCLIIPTSHFRTTTELDEEVWEEMKNFRRLVVKMYQDQDQDCVVFETSMFLQRHPHLYWECVPMPKEIGDLAPIYFKKAIQECETEWSQNKKLVDLRGRDVRRSIPKGLPYFSVDFGNDSGFAHVIEDEVNFPKNFAYEIIGGMMELDFSIWRKRTTENFTDQRKKVLKFLQGWSVYENQVGNKEI